LVIERSSRSPAPAWPEGFAAAHHRRYGDSTLWYGFRS
jgi:16S rRNA (guanine966-N2)-methyltransferase